MLYFAFSKLRYKNLHAGLKLHQDAKYKHRSIILLALATFDKRISSGLEEKISDVSLA
jgi:hypothetical protein